MGAQAQAAPGAVRCGKLLDVRAGHLLENQLILWDKDRLITSTGAANSAPSGVVPIDLLDSTCLPGLIDVHTHITFDPQDSGYKSLGISVPRETVIGVEERAPPAALRFHFHPQRRRVALYGRSGA